MAIETKAGRMNRDLSRFRSEGFDRGRSRWVEGLWLLLQGLAFHTWLPGSGWRVRLLRAFGATVGVGVVIKPHVRVKFPWRLTIGDHSWIGEGVWIDNLDAVVIGSSVCLSQGVYICTGNHDARSDSFDLMTKPVQIRDSSWVGAQCVLLPGAVVQEGAFVKVGTVFRGDDELAGNE